MPRPYSAALPIANFMLRALIVLNWLFFTGTLALLFVLPHKDWIIISLKLTPSAEADRVVMGFRAIAVIGLFMAPLYHLILTRLLAIVGTVRAGDPFVIANAKRLHRVAWAMLGLQFCGFVIGLIVKAISTPAHPVDINAGISVPGLLAILLAFVLASVFAEGARMREDLEGTV
jgi:hypothetical protein